MFWVTGIPCCESCDDKMKKENAAMHREVIEGMRTKDITNTNKQWW